MSVTAAPRTRHPSLRIAVLIGWYLFLGSIAWATVALAGWMADPCSPDCTSVSGSDYAETRDAVLGLGGLLYILACVPLAVLRTRGIVWLVPVLAFLVVTVGGIAMLSTAKGGLCDCGLGAQPAAVQTGSLERASGVSPMAALPAAQILAGRGRKEGP